MKGKVFIVSILGLMAFLWMGKGVEAAYPLRLYWSSPVFSLATGEKKTVSLMMDSGSGYVSAFQLEFKNGVGVKVNRVDVNETNFAGVLRKEINSNGEVMIDAHNLGKYTNQLPKGVFEVAKFEIEGLSNAQSEFLLNYSSVVGSYGTEMVYFSVNYEQMTVNNIVENGVDPILKYKIKFGSVSAGKCAVSWPIQVIVLGNGSTKVYNQVTPQKIGTNGIFGGTLQLTGFPHTNNIAVFFKGPKHLQMKYARQNQSTSYDKAGGELTLTTSAATSPEYDFTAYPMLPGDIVGNSPDEAPNGVINGVDFSYLKNRPSHESVAEGGYLKGDLDGNCQINTNDVNILKLSLETKQGELY